MFYAIGDIHGEITLLERLYSKILSDITENGDSTNTIIFLGDYIDRGENSKLVLEFIMSLNNSDSLSHIFLMGNHEEMMVDAFSPGMMELSMWMNNGGHTTFRDFDTTVYTFKSSDMLRCAVWLNGNCVYYHQTDDYVFCHGGLRLDVPLDETANHVFTWKRCNNPSEYDAYDRLVVHGHTPQTLGIPQVLNNEINVDTHAVYTKKLTCAVLPNIYDNSETKFLNT